MKHLAFALIAALLPTVAHAQQAMDEELPPGMAPDEPSDDYLLAPPEVEGPTQPHRIFLTLGGGSSVRFIKDKTWAQDRFAPAFLDLFGAFVFGSSADLRHGVGLGVSSNLTGDGGPMIGVDGFQQLALAPTYLAYLRFGWDLALTGKVGVPFVVSPDTAAGVELSVGGVYYLLAGFGPYAEIGVSTWLGGPEESFGDRLHPIASVEVGVAIDYEVLP